MDGEIITSAASWHVLAGNNQMWHVTECFHCSGHSSLKQPDISFCMLSAEMASMPDTTMHCMERLCKPTYTHGECPEWMSAKVCQNTEKLTPWKKSFAVFSRGMQEKTTGGKVQPEMLNANNAAVGCLWIPVVQPSATWMSVSHARVGWKECMQLLLITLMLRKGQGRLQNPLNTQIEPGYSRMWSITNCTWSKVQCTSECYLPPQ